jgi:hypothetical protein
LENPLSRIRSIELIEGKTGAIVLADLVVLEARHVEDYEQVWREPLRELGEEDKTFSWRFKEQSAQRNPNYEAYAIEHGGLTQGMILLETQNRWSLFTTGRRIVFVEAIVSAPWNRKWIQNPPELKDVGRSLLKYARQRSVELGYGGLVGLYSLPGAVRFYEQMGMMPLELSPEDIIDPEENVPYFEYRAQRSKEGRDR